MLTISTGASTSAAKMRRGFLNLRDPKQETAHTLGHHNDFVNALERPGKLMLCWSDNSGERGQPLADLMEVLHSTIFTSPIGPLFLAASTRGLVALEFDRRLPGQQTIRPNPRNVREENGSDIDPSDAIPSKRNEKAKFAFELSDAAMQHYIDQLEEYFAGKRRKFSFHLDLRGTEFQLACWDALVAIPYGETRSYADIARAVGRPSGFRAVGMANNRNPVAIVVPCHRVIASDGSLCGYGGGLDIKRKLLELEGALSGTLAA